MTLATICIPIAPYHTDIAARAIASAKAQTISADILTFVDVNGLGAGAARNRMLEEVITPYVVFLDADDWIEPDFIERCLAVIRPAHYVYTDYFEDEHVIEAPDCAWIDKTSHVVTTLLPTDAAKAIGGFDETFPGGEDTDFYVKLNVSGTCGIRLPLSLFHYGGEGQRSKTWRASPEYAAVMMEIKRRYGGKQMGCCGDKPKAKVSGDKQPGDVLLQALWRGNREETGRISGRQYQRTQFPATFWGDPRDAQANPRLFRIIESAPTPIPTATAEGVMRTLHWSTPPTPAPLAPTRPDIGRVLRLAGVRPDPVFVRPDKDYASYRDFWRLVELAGFPVMRQSEAGFVKTDYIFVTPEPLPEVRNYVGRRITWEFEYSGDYMHDLSNWRGEVWSSDPAHAQAVGARYVILGSDARLAERQRTTPTYDLSMLAYMTPRRQALKDQLSAYRWAQDYADGDQRADLLAQTRLMLHVHQHDNAPYAAPLRYALAAAYDLPLVSETIAEAGVYRGAVYFTDYEYMPQAVEYALQHVSGGALHKLLCETHTFRGEVEKALWS